MNRISLSPWQKIYSDNTVVYSKRRSLQDHSHQGSETEPEDLFSPPGAAGRPPLVPEQAWNTLRQIPPTREAETSLIEEKRDQNGSIRYDTVKLFILEVHKYDIKRLMGDLV